MTKPASPSPDSLKLTVHALLVHNHKLLLHLRDEKHPDPNLRNKWGLVGGGQEQGEDSMAAILREIKEETNLEPSQIKYLGKLEMTRLDQKIEASMYCAQLSDEEVKHLKLGNEGLEVKFFSTDEISNLQLSPEVKKYYEVYKPVIDKFINEDELPNLLQSESG